MNLRRQVENKNGAGVKIRLFPNNVFFSLAGFRGTRARKSRSISCGRSRVGAKRKGQRGVQNARDNEKEEEEEEEREKEEGRRGGGGYRWREHERSKTSREEGVGEGNAREKRGTRDVWTSLRRNGWVRLEQTRVRGIIRRFIRLLSRSYSALFIRPGEPAFFLPPRYLLYPPLPLSPSSRAKSNSTKGAGDETEIKKREREREREFRGWCGARGSWLKYTSEPRGFLLISPPSLRLSPQYHPLSLSLPALFNLPPIPVEEE